MNQARKSRRGDTPVKSVPLQKVLGQAEEIKESIEDAAIDLASVNQSLKQEPPSALPAEKIEGALARNEEAEQQVAKAAVDLEHVNTELAKEVAERIDIESELADTKVDLAEAREDLSISRANEEETRQAAHQDALTGLPNRLAFERRLDHGLVQAKRHGSGVAVLFVDLDRFKSINDSHGHGLGDKVLLMVANRLQSLVRGEDMVSRWGGDEFVCVLLGVSEAVDVAGRAESMIRSVAETFEVDGTAFTIRASIGVAMFPRDGDAADVLLKKADEAMYQAKRSTTRVRLFGESAAD